MTALSVEQHAAGLALVNEALMVARQPREHGAGQLTPLADRCWDLPALAETEPHGRVWRALVATARVYGPLDAALRPAFAARLDALAANCALILEDWPVSPATTAYERPEPTPRKDIFE